MLRITVELVPWGVESRARIIATGTIANTGMGTPTRGDYRIELRDAAGRKWKTGHIENFPRKRLLAWDLLYRALGKVVGGRNSTPKTLATGALDGNSIQHQSPRRRDHDRATAQPERHPQAPQDSPEVLAGDARPRRRGPSPVQGTADPPQPRQQLQGSLERDSDRTLEAAEAQVSAGRLPIAGVV